MDSDADATAARIHDALRSAPTSSPAHRALHAKGTLAMGRFTATGTLDGLTVARHLVTGSTGALVRFSHPGGDPDAPDAAPGGRGMAVKLSTLQGSHDLVAVSSPAFLARDGAAFLELLAARAPDPDTGVPDPARMLAYVESHPEALPAVRAAMDARVPASYATLAYNGLHTFFLVDRDGVRRPFRYSWVPVGGEQFLDDPPSGLDLASELAERLSGPPEGAAFDLTVHLGLAGDPTGDPTALWPERPTRVAGRLQLDAPADGGGPVIFDPNNVVDGVAVDHDDEILRLRGSVYGLSYATRTAADDRP